MNPNDIYAQQQALLNQAMQHAQQIQQMQWAFLAIYAAMFIFSMLVVYLFYARLRDIAEELRMLRIAYETAEDRKARATKPTPSRADDDSRYVPKS